MNAAVARKSRFPTLSQLYSTKNGNTALESEKSLNTTLSVSHPLGATARLELGGFYYDVRNLISRNGSGSLNIYQNIGQVRMAGFETVVEVTPVPDLSLRADYTYVHSADQSDGRVTDDVTNVPAHKAGFLASVHGPGSEDAPRPRRRLRRVDVHEPPVAHLPERPRQGDRRLRPPRGESHAGGGEGGPAPRRASGTSSTPTSRARRASRGRDGRSRWGPRRRSEGAPGAGDEPDLPAQPRDARRSPPSGGGLPHTRYSCMIGR